MWKIFAVSIWRRFGVIWTWPDPVPLLTERNTMPTQEDRCRARRPAGFDRMRGAYVIANIAEAMG